jgi:hypothetical protein
VYYYYSIRTTYMADDLYVAADERAREARRAGLQAKKDEQPLNTTRSYAAKQREWKVRAPIYPPPPLPSSYCWPANACALELVPYSAQGAGRLSI